MIVTHHAAERYVERVNGRATIDEAKAALQSYARVVDAAAAFGCRVVRLGCKAKLILVGERVVTVITADRPLAGHLFKGDVQ